MPLLSELVEQTNAVLAQKAWQGHIYMDAPEQDPRIQSLSADSRSVAPHSLFIAQGHGMAFIADAKAHGAVAVLHDYDTAIDLPKGMIRLRSKDMRAAASALAASFYDRQPQYVFGITGTDGKTSTADFVRQLAELLKCKSASIGTLGLRSPFKGLNAEFQQVNTSPDPIVLHRTLSQLADKKVDYVAIEASSHGLDQKRLDDVKFTAAAFTNLTRDHLDYHQTIAAYFTAKKRLFDVLLPQYATAVINIDDAYAKQVAQQPAGAAPQFNYVTFGYDAAADYRIVSVTPHARGLDAVVRIRGKEHALKLPLYGAFQLSNMLAAVGLLQAAGLTEEKLIAQLHKLKGVPGRLEKIAEQHGAPIFIDYAHTPAALENILKTLRPHTQKKLHVVFGCGGDRDAGKRPEMGAAAAKFADVVIVTDDNPRSEDPAKIRAAILAQAPGAQEIPDRDAAIRQAIQQLQAGDVLVIAGKGHETTQTIGNQVIPFNDADHIRKAIAA